MAAITIPGENLIASKQGNNEVLTIDKMVLANIPGLNPEDPVDREEQMPPEDQIVLNEEISQFGAINPNLVVYSLMLSTGGESFDFNWLGLYASEDDVIIAITYLPTQSKDPSVAMTRNFMLEFSGATETTDIHIDAESWQVDYSARVNGMDERARVTNEAVFGRQLFYGDTCKVVEDTGGYYKVLAGDAAYVAGIRFSYPGKRILIEEKPTSVWLDVSQRGDAMSDVVAIVEVVVSDESLNDYVDSDGVQHYLEKTSGIGASYLTDYRRINVRALSGVTHETRLQAEDDENLNRDFISVNNYGNANYKKVVKDEFDKYPAESKFIDKYGGLWVPRYGTIIDAQHFGVIPDTGKNLTSAFQGLAKFLSEVVVSGFNVVFASGEYICGLQNINPSPSSNQRYYQSVGDTFSLQGCHNFKLDFSGSVLKFADGLRYGSFDPLTGNPYFPDGNFTNSAYAAVPDTAIRLDRCSDYVVTKPTIEGNMKNLIIGGRWGDKGIQLSHIGYREQNCNNGITVSPIANYCGLDGIYMSAPQRGDEDDNLMHINPVCIGNGRQGMSITGSQGITLINPYYADTGKNEIATMPQAGIDIELNTRVNKNIRLYNPTLLNNKGADFLCLFDFEDVHIQGGVICSSSRGVWVESHDNKRQKCKFEGTDLFCNVVWSQATIFNGCTFEDKEYAGYKMSQGSLFENVSETTEVNNCNFYLNEQNLIYVNSGRFNNTKFHFRADNPAPRSRAAVFRPFFVNDVQFIQEYTNVDPILENSGERTYIDMSGTDFENRFRGESWIEGNALAVNSRTGTTNYMLSRAVQQTYGEEYTVPLEGEGPYKVPLGYGTNLINIRGFTTSRQQEVLIQCTPNSTSDRNDHHVSRLAFSGSLEEYEIDFVIENGHDVAVISTSVSQDGWSLIVRKVPLSETIVSSPVLL